MVKINTKNQIANMATKILTIDTIRYFSKIVLGSVDVDQSLNVVDPKLIRPDNEMRTNVVIRL